jgi:hypothetical protein
MECRLVARAEPSNPFARGGSARSEEGYGQGALSMTQLLPLHCAKTTTGVCESLQRLYEQACDDAHMHSAPEVGISFGQGLPHESVPPVPPPPVPPPPVPPPPAPPAPLAVVPLLVVLLLLTVVVLVVLLAVVVLVVLPPALALSLLFGFGSLVSSDGVSVQLMTATLMMPSADRKKDKRNIVYASRGIVILNFIERKRSLFNAPLGRFLLRRKRVFIRHG